MLFLSLFITQAALAMGILEKSIAKVGDVWDSGKAGKAAIIATSAATAATLYKLRRVIARTVHKALPDSLVDQDTRHNRRVARDQAEDAKKITICNKLLNELRNDAMTDIQVSAKFEELLQNLPSPNAPGIGGLKRDICQILLDKQSRLQNAMIRVFDTLSIQSGRIEPVQSTIAGFDGQAGAARVQALLNALQPAAPANRV